MVTEGYLYRLLLFQVYALEVFTLAVNALLSKVLIINSFKVLLKRRLSIVFVTVLCITK
ncbi:hypothetical protein C8D94_103358 [Marinirhabdus gelatinilytica]|uniref:Uncharacterized protein n=1 Tax=Marinirhabdus gelatinilytica TaxID=1703343 RepID=A0A370QAX5_9FLAO|nr:hypothetical protein C8D94_103358 [Marinirhabdus gelatinilytica]